jgi:hypothetical protein
MVKAGIVELLMRSGGWMTSPVMGLVAVDAAISG